MLEALGTLRTCLKKNAGKIADTSGSHAKWQDVQVNDQGKWAWYDLPEAKAVVQVQPVKKK
jgi:hypothetical protein